MEDEQVNLEAMKGGTDGRVIMVRTNRQNGKKQKFLEHLWLEHVNRMETNRIVSNSTGVTYGRLSTLREQKQQKCLEQPWLEHVNGMETNRIVSNSTGVTY